MKGVTFHKALLDEHCRMYVMGEKYDILGLKAVALTTFRRQRHPRQMTTASVITVSAITATVTHSTLYQS
jgi:hypothetical protein